MSAQSTAQAGEEAELHVLLGALQTSVKPVWSTQRYGFYPEVQRFELTVGSSANFSTTTPMLAWPPTVATPT
jgi:hypothetical protein